MNEEGSVCCNLARAVKILTKQGRRINGEKNCFRIVRPRASQKPALTIVRATLPYIGILLIALIIITYVPALSLWLVNVLGVK
jgi:hypothetical protein